MLCGNFDINLCYENFGKFPAPIKCYFTLLAMKKNCTVVLFFCMALNCAIAQPSRGPRKPAETVVTVEARNETAAPGFSRHVRDARSVTAFLTDALLLTTAQRHAVARCTVAQRQALALAATDADIAQAQRDYLMALRQVLGLSQLHTYTALCQQLAGTMLPLSAPEAELAMR